MMMRNAVTFKTARFLILALLTSLFPSLAFSTSATANVETVTKNFIVKNSAGQPLSGALIQINYWDEANQKSIYSDVYQTASNGTVSVIVPKNTSEPQYVVAPPLGNTTDAISSLTNFSNSSDGNVEVNLSAANYVFSISKSDGTAPPKGTFLIIGKSLYSMAIRGGALGISIAKSTMTVGGSDRVFVARDISVGDSPEEFSWNYGARLQADGTIKFYTDMTFTSELLPVNGVYSFQLKRGNISGRLLKADGTVFTVPNGVSVTVNTQYVTPPNSPAPNFMLGYGGTSNAKSDGTWYGRAFGNLAGKYQVNVRVSGTSELSSFTTFFWKNSSGQFSLAENGPFSDGPFQMDLREPSGAKFKYKTVFRTTNQTIPTSVNINLLNAATKSFEYFTYINSKDGTGSIAMPDGQYQLSVYPMDPTLSVEVKFNLTVTNGVYSVKDDANQTIAVDSNGFFNLIINEPNLKVQAVDPNNNSLFVEDVSVNVEKGEKGDQGWQAGGWTGNTFAQVYLPVGTYRMTLWPNAPETYSEKSYVVTVNSSGVASITGFQPNSSGIFVLPLEAPNFKFKLVDPVNSSTVLSNAWLEYCKLDSNGKYAECMGKGINEQGFGSAKLANGNYEIKVYPNGSSLYVTKTYSATVTNGTVTVAGATVADSRFVLTVQSPNVSGALKSNGAPITFTGDQGIYLNLQKKNGQNWEWLDGQWRNSAQYGFNVKTEGEYRVIARTFNFAGLANSYSESFSVDASGNVRKGTTGSFVNTITDLDIAFTEGNLKLKVIDPSATTPNTPLNRGWVVVFKKTNNGDMWQDHIDVSPVMAGLVSAQLEAGSSYRIEVNAESSLGFNAKSYDVEVPSSGTPTVKFKGNDVTFESNRFIVGPSLTNSKGRIVRKDSAGNSIPLVPGNNTWVNINLQKQNAQGFWEWTPNWASTDNGGKFSVSVSEAGKFRLRIEPMGNEDAALTYSEPFTVSPNELETFSKDFGDVVVDSPLTKIKIPAPNGGADQEWIGIAVWNLNDGSWVDWFTTGSKAVAAIPQLPDGRYTFEIYPNDASQNLGAARKKYTYTVTTTNNVKSGSFGVDSNVSVANGYTTLQFGTGTLTGFVKSPDGLTKVPYSTVIPIDAATNREMWEYSTQSNNEGKFVLSLPQGSYKVRAMQPWGNATYGSSSVIGTISVDANGAVNGLTGLASESRTATSFDIRLKIPTWSGVVKAPGSSADVVPYAQVCLAHADSWICSQATDQGRWALSAPDDFQDFSANAVLEVGDVQNRRYPSLRVNGSANVAAILNVVDKQNIELRFPTPNMTVTVKAGNTPASNVWVNVDTPGQWLGGNATNSEGKAYFFVPDPKVLLNIRAELGGNKTYGVDYTSTLKVVNADSGRSSVDVTVDLNSPNFRGVLCEPNACTPNADSSGYANRVPFSWVDVINDESGEWIGGSNTDEFGRYSLFLPTGCNCERSYTVRVYPAWDATTDYARGEYTVVMNANNTVKSVNIKGQTSAVVSLLTLSGYTNRYGTTLAQPSVVGTVYQPDGVTKVRDSWIVPRDATTSWYLWEYGANSKFSGKFSMNLPNGQYRVEANPSWTTPTLSRSAGCVITVESNQITTAATSDGCVQQEGDKKVLKLKLRQPNVTFTLKSGSNPIRWANVGFALGAWWINAQSNDQGIVSVFIDPQAIKDANPGLTGTQKFFVWVDPPYGSTNMVRWDCQSGDQNKPICKDLPDVTIGTEYNNGVAISIPEIQVLGPNTKIKVTEPNTSNAVGAWGWVNVFRLDSNNNRYWIANANTDANGEAYFNLDTSTVGTKFTLEVNAPWNKRLLYASKSHDNGGVGYTWDQLNNGSYPLAAPNIKFEIKSPGGVNANKYGWLNLEKVDANQNSLGWVGGYGLDETGGVSMYVETSTVESKFFRLTAGPGYGRTGVVTTCVIEFETTTVIKAVPGLCAGGSFTSNTVTLTLNAGNVTGTVKTSNGTPVVEAVVYAQGVAKLNGTTVSTIEVTSCSDVNGRFGIQLPRTYNHNGQELTYEWLIRILPFNKPGAATMLQPLNYKTDYVVPVEGVEFGVITLG